MIAGHEDDVRRSQLQNTPLDLIAEKQRQIEALGWREYDRGDPWVVKYEKDLPEGEDHGADPGLRRVMGDCWLSADDIASQHEETGTHKKRNGWGDRSDGGKERTLSTRSWRPSYGQGFEIETHTDTHAIVVEGDQGKAFLSRFRVSGAAKRYVVSVDEHGEVTMIPAEPKRS